MIPRTVFSWAENPEIFSDIGFAFHVTFLNKCDELERPLVAELLNSATNGRSSSSHLLRKVTWNAKPMSEKISGFSAQENTVRGIITVYISPLENAGRVRPAGDTALCTREG